MINSVRGTRGMAVAPHALAAQSALAVLREGGNAIEAMIAAAACIAVVYPHMNSIGGDGFWIKGRKFKPIGFQCIHRKNSATPRSRHDGNALSYESSFGSKSCSGVE